MIPISPADAAGRPLAFRRTLLIGETGSGKRSVIQVLSGTRLGPHRPMALEFCGPFINTPGEFLENPRFYHALITAAADCDILLLVQDATRNTSLFPPLFAAMFNRTVLGVITRADAPNANTVRAERFLRSAGVRGTIVPLSESGTGRDPLRALLSE